MVHMLLLLILVVGVSSQATAPSDTSGRLQPCIETCLTTYPPCRSFQSTEFCKCVTAAAGLGCFKKCPKTEQQEFIGTHKQQIHECSTGSYDNGVQEHDGARPTTTLDGEELPEYTPPADVTTLEKDRNG